MCGRTGHKSADCLWRLAGVDVEDAYCRASGGPLEDYEDGKVGGVWVDGNAEEDEDEERTFVLQSICTVALTNKVCVSQTTMRVERTTHSLSAHLVSSFAFSCTTHQVVFQIICCAAIFSGIFRVESERRTWMETVQSLVG